MRLLADTHALIWWVNDDPKLGPIARRELADEYNQIYISAASAWEITTKHRLGKLPEAAAFASDVLGRILAERFLPLPVTVEHAEMAGRLDGAHRDPFDRMLIAQALSDKLVLVSNEAVFDAFGVARLW